MNSQLKWLQWSTKNLSEGLGGVEVYAQCLARELKKLGVETAFSTDPQELKNPKWDVIQTHGSLISIKAELSDQKSFHKKKPVRVFTGHGFTFDRMRACREWFWPGGYLATAREIFGWLKADVVLSTHPGLVFYDWSKKTSKVSQLAPSGWDAADPQAPTKLPSQIKLPPPGAFWVFIGRGSDFVKGADIAGAAFNKSDDPILVCVPGDGFSEKFLKTGRLSSQEVVAVLKCAKGLVLTSRHEGGTAIVVSEALAQGALCVAIAVGGVKALPSELLGFFPVDARGSEDIRSMVKKAQMFPDNFEERQKRVEHNRKLLPSWRDTARASFDAVQEFLKTRQS